MNLNSIIRKRGVQVGAAAAVFLAVAVSLAVMSASPGGGRGAPDPLVAGDTTGDVAMISGSNGLDSASTRTAAPAVDDGTASGAPAGTLSSPSSPGESTSDGNDESAASPDGLVKRVRVMWWNDAEDVPVEGFLISIGASSWSPDETADSDTGALSVTVDKPSVVVIYPDGPGGSRIEVPILFEKMMKDDSEQDAIIVEVSDARIRVLGNPVENVDQTFDRF